MLKQNDVLRSLKNKSENGISKALKKHLGQISMLFVRLWNGFVYKM